jgi:hypothetical protein
VALHLPAGVQSNSRAGHKLGKTRQDVFVFVKRAARKATAAVGPVDVAWPEGMDEGQETNAQ